MSEDLIGRAREIDKQLPKAPWKVGEVSCSQADIVDCYGGWICTIRKDFDEGDPEDHPLIVELRNMLPELLAAFSQPKAPTDAEIAEIEKWSRWSLQSDITTDGETLKNAIGHVAALLKIVRRQSAEIAGMVEIVDTAGRESVRDVKEAVRQRDEALAGIARSIAVTDEKIAEGEQWRDKWRKAVAEQTADRIEIERLHNALEAAEKKLADLREVDAATCRDVTRCADKCARLRGELEHVRGELAVAGKMIVKVREEANQQRARAEASEASMAKRWHKGPPIPGRWRLSIRPDLRNKMYPPILEGEVFGGYFKYGGGDHIPIDNHRLGGALWQRIEESADPFSAVERPSS